MTARRPGVCSHWKCENCRKRTKRRRIWNEALSFASVLPAWPASRIADELTDPPSCRRAARHLADAISRQLHLIGRDRPQKRAARKAPGGLVLTTLSAAQGGRADRSSRTAAQRRGWSFVPVHGAETMISTARRLKAGAARRFPRALINCDCA